MEADPTTTQASDEQITDASLADAQAASGESGGAEPEEARTERPNDVFRAAIFGTSPSLKPLTLEPTGESTPENGAVKPGDGRVRDASGRFVAQPQADQQGLGRRGAAERIAELERQVAERDPAQVRQQVLDDLAREASTNKDAEQAKADAERYLRLRDLPDDHPELTQGDSWQWLQEQKALRANYPKAASALRAEADAIVARELSGLQQREDAFLSDVAGQMKRVGARYDANFDEYRGQTSFEAMAEYLIEHVAKPLRERITRLETEQSQQLRLQGPRGLGSVREPIGAGRSSPVAPEPSINDVFRAAAFGRR